MSVIEHLRSFALGLPEAHEDFPWGESVVKVNNKVFVFLGSESEPTSDGSARDAGMTVKLAESHDEALAVNGAEPTHYGLGKHGWISLPVGATDGPPAEVLCDWIEESYRIVAPKRLVKLLDTAAGLR